MDATPYLIELAKWFSALRIDAVMIGNAAAVIHGAPLTTVDMDFMLEHSDENYRKLAALAQRMDCEFVEMELPSDNYMYRLQHRTMPLVADFLFVVAGIDNYEALKKNSTEITFGERTLKVASLEDILASKRAAGRPKDLFAIPLLEMTLEEHRKQ
ncbi:MAG: hypothetical protein FWD57_03375 [Polyangiaceae bacterium]|nr:hypothetical protein [Polyangiaceae bacterium]